MVTTLRFAGFAILVAGASSTLPAQIPHVEGRVEVNPGAGLLEARICTSSFEGRPQLRFLLAAPMSIKTISDGNGGDLGYDGEYGGRIVGEAREYVISPGDTAPLPSTFCVEYRGAVPVFDRNTAMMDWKGRITSIQGVLRAAEQTRWYPTLIDSATGRLETLVSYRLEVSCPTCRSIYVNGAKPVSDTVGRFESVIPRDLLLLAGAFDFTETDALTFVGGPAGSEAKRVFSSAIEEIAGYYTKILEEPYRDIPVMLTFLSVSRDRRPGVPNWQFVTWPTIAMSGDIAFDSVLVREGGTAALPPGLWTTLSHEMGHYYYGTVMKPSGTLRWFALESMAEFLSLKAVYAIHGELAGTARLLNLAGSMGSATLPTLDQVQEADEITSTYRYRYAPVFFHALERSQGEAKVIALLRAILATPDTVPFDFAVLARDADRVGIPPGALSTGWDVNSLRTYAFGRARDAIRGAGNDARTVNDIVAIATTLVNVDTATSARLELMQSLRRLVARDSLRLGAQYQIGKIGAVTGRGLDVAQAALELYLRHSPPVGAPDHASAYWRLGMIQEHRGDRPQAIAAYRAALGLNPNHQASRTALTRLVP